MTIFNNTLYLTKGSGSNGINTVYQVGDAGSLPISASATAIAILPGFCTTLAGATSGTVYHPHGLWFADANTPVVNNSGATLSGTLAVTLKNLASGITLTNATGTVNRFPVLASAVSLAPGASRALSLKLSDPANLLINFTPVTTLQ